jgi:hypothetical protein
MDGWMDGPGGVPSATPRPETLIRWVADKHVHHPLPIVVRGIRGSPLHSVPRHFLECPREVITGPDVKPFVVNSHAVDPWHTTVMSGV